MITLAEASMSNDHVVIKYNGVLLSLKFILGIFTTFFKKFLTSYRRGWCFLARLVYTLMILISRSRVPVSGLAKLQDQSHPNTEVEVNVTVEDEVARVVQLGSEDHIAAGRDLDDIFGKAVACVGVVQFIISFLLQDELSANVMIIFASTNHPVPAYMLSGALQCQYSGPRFKCC